MELVIEYLKKRKEVELSKRFPDDFVVAESVRKKIPHFTIRVNTELVEQIDEAIKILEKNGK